MAIGSANAQLADLAPIAILNVPTTVTPNQNIAITCVVTNQGTGNAVGTWYDSIFISTNSVVDNTATRLTYITVNQGVTAGGSYTWGATVNIPQSVSGGLYHLFVVVDDPSEGGTQITEVTKGNNTNSVSIGVQLADLAPIAILNVPTTVTPNQNIAITCVVTNQGTGNAVGTWYDSIFISTNSVVDNSATRLTYITVNQGVTAGGSYTWGATVNIPQSVSGGLYHLFVVVDDPNEGGTQITEVTKANNTNSVSIGVQLADLAPIAILNVPTTVTPNQNIAITCVVTNQGTGNAVGTWYDSIFISTNSVVDNSATRLTYITVNQGVKAGSSYSWSTTVTIPASFSGGLYHLFVAVDDPSEGGTQITEISKINNTNFVGIAVGTPDLAATNLIVSNSVIIAGRPLTVSWTVVNVSTNAFVGNWYDSVTLSSNSTLSGAITNWDWYSNHSVPAGASYLDNQTFTLPRVAAGTNYYLIAQADNRNYVPDSNRSNNLVALQITITNLPPTNLVLLTPTNNLTITSCIPVSFKLSATVQLGSYAITNVEYFDGNVPIANGNSAAYNALSVPLPQGIHSLTARAMDQYNLQATSQVTLVTINWPTTNQLFMNVDSNHDCVVCMTAQSNQNILVQTTAAFQPVLNWQPYLTNPIVNETFGGLVLIFTNHPTQSQLFFRTIATPSP